MICCNKEMKIESYTTEDKLTGYYEVNHFYVCSECQNTIQYDKKDNIDDLDIDKNSI